MVQWSLICGQPESDMELCMGLLKLSKMKTTQELVASCKLFYAVWNAAAHMSWNGKLENVNFDAVKHKLTLVSHVLK